MSDKTRAFPGESNFDERRGMTLRDWFAGQALVALCQWAPYRDDGTAVYDHAEVQRIRSQHAYRTADAMLEARKAKP